MRRLLTGLALFLAPVPSMAQTSGTCLMPAEFSALATYSLPSIIKGVSERCGPSLGASGWLPRNGVQLASRYGQAKPGAWPGAKAAFFKFGGAGGGGGSGGSRDMIAAFRNLPDDKLQPIVDGVIEGLVSQQVPIEKCGTIDRVIGLVSPLPPQNTAELIALTAGLASTSGGGMARKLKLCPAG